MSGVFFLASLSTFLEAFCVAVQVLFGTFFCFILGSDWHSKYKQKQIFEVALKINGRLLSTHLYAIAALLSAGGPSRWCLSASLAVVLSEVLWHCLRVLV